MGRVDSRKSACLQEKNLWLLVKSHLDPPPLYEITSCGLHGPQHCLRDVKHVHQFKRPPPALLGFALQL